MQGHAAAIYACHRNRAELASCFSCRCYKRKVPQTLNVCGFILFAALFAGIIAGLANKVWYELRGPVVGYIGLEKLCVEHAYPMQGVEPVTPGCWNINAGLAKIADSPDAGTEGPTDIGDNAHLVLTGLVLSGIIALIIFGLHVASYRTANMASGREQANCFGMYGIFLSIAFTVFCSSAMYHTGGEWTPACDPPGDLNCIAFNEALELKTTSRTVALVTLPILSGIWFFGAIIALCCAKKSGPATEWPASSTAIRNPAANGP